MRSSKQMTRTLISMWFQSRIASIWICHRPLRHRLASSLRNVSVVSHYGCSVAVILAWSSLCCRSSKMSQNTCLWLVGWCCQTAPSTVRDDRIILVCVCLLWRCHSAQLKMPVGYFVVYTPLVLTANAIFSSSDAFMKQPDTGRFHHFLVWL